MTDDQQPDKLKARAQQLPRTLQPDPQLWDRIEVGISASHSTLGRSLRPPIQDSLGSSFKYAWPIAALTLLGVALATLSLTATRQQPAVAAWQPDPLMQTQLHQLLDTQLDDLPSEVRTTVIDNLAIIASARDEIRGALEQNPNSQLLHSLYLNSYANERTLLKDVEAMARQTKRRTQL